MEIYRVGEEGVASVCVDAGEHEHEHEHVNEHE